MVKVMLFNATEAEESRVAILEDNKLDEFYMERSSLCSRIGNIYMGKIVNIEPSIDSAFVDFGGSRHGFLHVSDLMENVKEQKKEGSGSGSDENDKKKKTGRKSSKKNAQSIGKLLSKGQDLIVQVTKDGIGNKAPALTTYISLPGRYLVYMPGTAKRGISRKIEDDSERNKLKELIDSLDIPEKMGLIVRTAGAGQTKQELKKDIRYLNNLWKAIQKRIKSQAAPATLYLENDLAIRALRDLYSSNVEEVLVDSEDVYKRISDFMKIVMPRQANSVKLYKGKHPLFDHYNVEKELVMLLDRDIPLKSGGSLVIEQTEALVAIDVNSGKFKGGKLEETAFQINIEAAKEIARQLRLRDLGGLIICDFIDMQEDEHKRAVEKMFRDSLKPDRARIKLARMSPFGIIELTRQRVRPSLKLSVFDRCDNCNGTGYVASLETSTLNIIRKIRLWVTNKQKELNIVVNPKIADYINNHKRRLLLELEDISNKKVTIVGSWRVPLGEIIIENEAVDFQNSENGRP